MVRSGSKRRKTARLKSSNTVIAQKLLRKLDKGSKKGKTNKNGKYQEREVSKKVAKKVAKLYGRLIDNEIMSKIGDGDRMKTKTFGERVNAITQSTIDRAKNVKEKKECVDRKVNQQVARRNAKKLVKVWKERIVAAAKQGEYYLDGFPTGLLGDELLHLLGPEFEANTNEYRIIGESDGQGYVDESTFMADTRLMWKMQ